MEVGRDHQQGSGVWVHEGTSRWVGGVCSGRRTRPGANTGGRGWRWCAARLWCEWETLAAELCTCRRLCRALLMRARLGVSATESDSAGRRRNMFLRWWEADWVISLTCEWRELFCMWFLGGLGPFWHKTTIDCRMSRNVSHADTEAGLPWSIFPQLFVVSQWSLVLIALLNTFPLHLPAIALSHRPLSQPAADRPRRLFCLSARFINPIAE